MNAATMEALIALARIDRDGHAIHDRLEAIPGRIARVEEEGARLRAEIERSEQELEEARKKRRGLEQEALDLASRMGADASKLNVIRNNVEYQAMLKQIADAKARKTAVENAALELMEREEELGRRLASDRKRVEAELGELAQERTALNEERSRQEAALAATNAERRRLLGELDPEVRGRYERLARGKRGLAVVPVVKGACGGCFEALPPQRVNEARLAERLVFCDGCSRILIWDEENGSL